MQRKQEVDNLSKIQVDARRKILAYILREIEKSPEALKLPAAFEMEEAFIFACELIKERSLPALKEYLETVPSDLFLSAAIRLFAYRDDSISVDFIMENFEAFERPLDAAFGYAWGKHLHRIDDTHGCGIPLYKAEGLAYGYHLDELNKYLALNENQDSETCIHACNGLIDGGHLDDFDSVVATLSKITSRYLRKMILSEVQYKPFPGSDLLPGVVRKIKMLRKIHSVSYEDALRILNDVDHANESAAIHSIGLFETAANKKLNFYQNKSVTELKGKGLTLSIMLNWCKKDKSFQTRDFGSSHFLALQKLMNMPEALSATDAIREISCLDDRQVTLLNELYQSGLRGNHLRAWQDANNVRQLSSRDVEFMLHQCLNEKVNPLEALQKISGETPLVRVIRK